MSAQTAAPTVQTTAPIVDVTDLGIAYRSGQRQVDVLTGVSLRLEPGGVLGLVGESGSGKSTLAGALLGSLRTSSFIASGSVRVAGQDVFALTGRALRRFRSSSAALVPQNAGAALTPTMKIAEQLVEVIRLRGAVARGAERAEAQRLLGLVRLPQPDAALDKHPHQFSGGQQQRIGIAMALAAQPSLLILDEPTTGLDVVTQAAVLDTLLALQLELGTSMVLVSHDLGVIERMCTQVAVLRGGEVVEQGPTAEVLGAPRHPYTRGLIASVPSTTTPGIPPSLDDAAVRAEERGEPVAPAGELYVRTAPADAPVVLQIRGLTVDYRRRHVPGTGPTVQDVDLDVHRGEVVALVGESGSGKSTIANVVAGLQARVAGEVVLEGGEPLAPTVSQRPKRLRRAVQMIFQNAHTSLNPRHTVQDAVERPTRLFGVERASVPAALADVDLPASFAQRLPGQLSGGQRQRVGIARAVVAEPTLVLADEIVSALDVSVQSSVLRLVDRLSVERDLGFLFITHDLAVVRAVADRVVVLYLGRVVEQGRAEEIFTGTSHPYTRLLLDSVIELGQPRTARVAGAGDGLPAGRDEVPAAPPEHGCPFASRCPLVVDRCRTEQPPVITLSRTHQVRCHADLEALERLGAPAAEHQETA